MNRKLAFAPMLLFSVCGMAATAHAQLSLSSAVDLALKNNPKVLSAAAEVEHSRATLSESRDAYVPVVNMAAGVGRSTGVPLGLPTLFTANAQSLVFNFSQLQYIRAARGGLDAAHLALEQAQDEVAEDVATTYVALDFAQQRKAAAEEALTHAQKLLSIVNDRVAAGQDPHNLIPRTHLTVLDLQQQLLHINADIAELSDHLSRITGLPGTTPAALHDSVPSLPSTESLGSAPAPATDSPGVQALFASARSKADVARGDARYLYRPQVSFSMNYSRVTTDFSNYSIYYPGFRSDRLQNLGLSLNSLSLGVGLQLPLFDRAHQAKARESAAEARKALYDAENARNLFQEGRLKLARALSDLDISVQRAQDNAEIAKDDLQAVLIQLQPGAAAVGTQPLTPKDEQNARLAIAQRRLDLVNAQLQLAQTKIQLMRQNGQLTAWVRTAINQAPATAQP